MFNFLLPPKSGILLAIYALVVITVVSIAAKIHMTLSPISIEIIFYALIGAGYAWKNKKMISARDSAITVIISNAIFLFIMSGVLRERLALRGANIIAVLVFTKFILEGLALFYSAKLVSKKMK